MSVYCEILVLLCVISGFRREGDENCALLGYYAAFRDNHSWFLKLGPIGSPETLISTYHCSLRNIIEQRSSRNSIARSPTYASQMPCTNCTRRYDPWLQGCPFTYVLFFFNSWVHSGCSYTKMCKASHMTTTIESLSPTMPPHTFGENCLPWQGNVLFKFSSAHTSVMATDYSSFSKYASSVNNHSQEVYCVRESAD